MKVHSKSYINITDKLSFFFVFFFILLVYLILFYLSAYQVQGRTCIKITLNYVVVFFIYLFYIIFIK